MREQTLLPQYLRYLLMEFDQTFTTNRLWGMDECIKFLGKRSRSWWGQVCSKMHILAL